MEKPRPSIIDFPGTFNKGIIAVICLTWDDFSGESVFFYTESELMFIPSEEVTQKTGPLEIFPWYNELVQECLSLCPPYEELCQKLPELKDM
jgi:hypothetical protein